MDQFLLRYVDLSLLDRMKLVSTFESSCGLVQEQVFIYRHFPESNYAASALPFVNDYFIDIDKKNILLCSSFACYLVLIIFPAKSEE